jgi:hypothetical protein
VAATAGVVVVELVVVEVVGAVAVAVMTEVVVVTGLAATAVVVGVVAGVVAAPTSGSVQPLSATNTARSPIVPPRLITAASLDRNILRLVTTTSGVRWTVPASDRECPGQTRW